MEVNKLYERIEDMSPDGKLVVFLENDGDIIVAVHAGNTTWTCSVEFCNMFNGGGRSEHTRKALIALAEAIEKDNKERPVYYPDPYGEK